MSQQAAAVAASCCCPREQVPSCTPTDSAVMLNLPPVRFQFGCNLLGWFCGNDTQGNQFGCCCPTCLCFGNGSPCDRPAWNCREVKPTGEVSGSVIMRVGSGSKYRTRIDCPNGINEALAAGRIENELHICESIPWPGGGGYTLYRQYAIGQRTCVGSLFVPSSCTPCNTGCSRDVSPSILWVRAVLQPWAGNEIVNGCATVVRKLHIAIDPMSVRAAAEWCDCNPNYQLDDLLSYGYGMEYYSYCCPSSPQDGVRGTYRARQDMLDAASTPITTECARSGPYTYVPVKWPATVTIT